MFKIWISIFVATLLCIIQYGMKYKNKEEKNGVIMNLFRIFISVFIICYAIQQLIEGGLKTNNANKSVEHEIDQMLNNVRVGEAPF